MNEEKQDIVAEFEEILSVRPASTKRTHELTEEEKNSQEKQLGGSFDKAFALIPDEIKEEETRKIIAEYLDMGFTRQRAFELLNRDITNLNLAFLDQRALFEKMGLRNRKYAEILMWRAIDEAAENKKSEKLTDENLRAKFRKSAIISFDMNGLKALNDIGGHANGDEGLKIFAKILQNGETSNWLRKELKCRAVAFSQGGDEFGVFVTGNVNLEALKNEIKEKYIDEMGKVETAKLIDFASEKAKKFLAERGITAPDGFKFTMGTSVGISTIEDALKHQPTEEELRGDRKNYFFRTRKLRDRVFLASDDTAQRHKELSKMALKNGSEAEQTLYKLYNLRSAEAEKEIREQKKKIDCMEGLLGDKNTC